MTLRIGEDKNKLTKRRRRYRRRMREDAHAALDETVSSRRAKARTPRLTSPSLDKTVTEGAGCRGQRGDARRRCAGGSREALHRAAVQTSGYARAPCVLPHGQNLGELHKKTIKKGAENERKKDLRPQKTTATWSRVQTARRASARVVCSGTGGGMEVGRGLPRHGGDSAVAALRAALRTSPTLREWVDVGAWCAVPKNVRERDPKIEDKHELTWQQAACVV